MLNLSIPVNETYVVEPITHIDGGLIGFELLTHFSRDIIGETIDTQIFIMKLPKTSKRELLLNQLQAIKLKSLFFLDLCVVCTLNIDLDMADIILRDDKVRRIIDSLPFIRLEVSENFPNLSDGIKNSYLNILSKRYKLWLDDLGAGNSNMSAVQSGIFECIKIDKNFFWKNSGTCMWPILIKNICQYANQIVIEGVENLSQLSTLRNTPGITGVQGYMYKGVPLCHVETFK